jgi:hypothetical protein
VERASPRFLEGLAPSRTQLAGELKDKGEWIDGRFV